MLREENLIQPQTQAPQKSKSKKNDFKNNSLVPSQGIKQLVQHPCNESVEN